MNDDQILLANAYFDGQLDADERERAEADPVVLAEVERLSALAMALNDVAPPAPGTREAAIAAALHEFDSSRRSTPAVVPISRSTRPARKRTNQWLAVAAGVLGVGLFGVVVAQNGFGGGDDDDSGITANQLDRDLVADDAAGEEARVFEATAESAAASDVDAAAEAFEAQAPMLESAVSAPATGEDSATTEASAPAEGASDQASISTSAPAAVWTFDPEVAIPDQQALADVGTELLQQESDGRLANTPETRCGADHDPPLSVLADGLYQLEDGTVVAAWIAIDRLAGTTYALDMESCAALAVATQ